MKRGPLKPMLLGLDCHGVEPLDIENGRYIVGQPGPGFDDFFEFLRYETEGRTISIQGFLTDHPGTVGLRTSIGPETAGFPVLFGDTDSVLASIDHAEPDHFGRVYAIFFGNGRAKVGMSSQPRTRIKAIIDHAKIYFGLTVDVVAMTIPCTNYKELEREAHKSLEHRNVGGELFQAIRVEVIDVLSRLIPRDDSERLAAESRARFEALKAHLLGDPTSA